MSGASEWSIHGTYAGWNEHKRNETLVCEPCKLAHNEYMRRYRLRTSQTDRNLVPTSLVIEARALAVMSA